MAVRTLSLTSIFYEKTFFPRFGVRGDAVWLRGHWRR